VNQTKVLFSSFRAVRDGAILLFFMTLMSTSATALADDGLEPPRVPRDNFSFDGLKLPTSISQLKEQYPAAQGDSLVAEEKVGLTCCLVKNLPSADSARFCFYDDFLYQAQFSYNAARIAAQGGMPAVRRKLVAYFGPPDHVDEVRMTWRLNASHRADFYTAHDGRVLVITDASLTSRVDQRRRNETLTSAVELGF
jgi:hypothetical protein